MATELTAEEARVLGSLIEKQLTTPQLYPLSLNALVLACNQASNRQPVVHYEEAAVSQALDRLKERRLVRFVLPSHGRSVTRYRQVADESMGLDHRQLALLAVLLLRGPQTVGELRSRTERLANFDHLGEVEQDLRSLAAREEPLVSRMPRRPGQKEDRWRQLLSEQLAEGEATAPPRPEPVVEPDPAPNLAALRDEVVLLRRELQELRAIVADLRASLGG
jgi:uncharacterized protein YceH (UPF0502 family)